MGAVSSLLYASKNIQKISCLVLDSPFSNLQKLLEDIVKSYKILPSIIAKFAYNKVREQIL